MHHTNGNQEQPADYGEIPVFTNAELLAGLDRISKERYVDILQDYLPQMTAGREETVFSLMFGNDAGEFQRAMQSLFLAEAADPLREIASEKLHKGAAA